MKQSKILMIYPVCQVLRERAFPLGFYIASSVLKSSGFEVRCLELWSNNDWKAQLEEQLHDFCPQIIGFSVCGATNYKFALDIVKSMQLHKHYKIRFGGQHIQSPTQMGCEYYEGEKGYIENREKYLDVQMNVGTALAPVDYSLVNNPLSYLPAVEISRGCWNLCQFCNADNMHLEKPIEQIQKELHTLSEIYPKDTILTLGGSNHLFKKWKKRGMISLLKEYGSHFKFNFNCGVESGWESAWDDILSLNIWNIFVGVEAVNESTLLHMKKTRTPKNYIKKASELLHRCATDDVYAFVTYIYGYPFDGLKELEALDRFILGHSHKNIVQLGEPIQAYPGTKLLIDQEYYKSRGITYHHAFDNNDSPVVEYYYLDVSDELNFNYLKQRSSEVFTQANQYKDSFYRCSGFRNFESFESFEKNINYYASFFKE